MVLRRLAPGTIWFNNLLLLEAAGWTLIAFTDYRSTNLIRRMTDKQLISIIRKAINE